MRKNFAAFAAVLALSCPAWATVNSPGTPAVYTCNGSTSIFTIPWPYLAPSQVVATQTTGGVVTTVFGTVKPSIAPTTGTLTLPAACPSGSTLTITRSVPFTQTQSFRTGSYSGPVHEQAFDRTEMQLQQLNASTIAKDAAQDLATSGLAAALATLTGVNPGATANVKNYNAKGDGTTNDTAAIIAAYNVVKATGGTIYFPAGVYLFNLVIDAPNVSIIGAGRGATGATHVYQGGPIGGTTFRPFDKTKPVIQIGNGTVKTTAITLRDFTVLGDASSDVNMVYTAGTATSDGIVQVGAHYVTITNVDIAYMGGDGYRVTSSATQPSFWTTLVSVNVVGCGAVGMHFVYGPLWVTTINVIGGSSWSLGSGANTYAVRSEGVGLLSSAFWAETQVSGHLAYLDYDTSRAIPPLWAGSGTTNLDSGASTDTLIEINTVGSSIPTRRTTTLFINGLLIDGQIKWTADAVLIPKSSFAKLPSSMVLGQLGFNATLNDSRDEPTTPTRILQGGGIVGAETLDVTGSSLRTPGTFQYGYRFLNKNGTLFQGDTGSGLRFSPSGTPSGEGNGQSISTVRFVSTFSGGMAFDLVNGNWFFISATSPSGFSLGAPASGGKPLTVGDRATFTIANATAGALGVATWNAVFKMAAWVQPAAGFNRTITFWYDGTNWIEVSRTPADVPN